MVWPAVPDGPGALMLAFQYQLEQSEWLAPAEIEAHQFEALTRVLAHSVHTVPYYRDHPVYASVASGPGLAERWRDLPVMLRGDIQEAGPALVSGSIPADHLPTRESWSSGSTGGPVRAVGTQVTHAIWLALTLRQHLWHDRDLSGRFASIRAAGTDDVPETGDELASWGPATAVVYDTGPAAVLGVRTDVKVQADWLLGQDPDYLLSLPSNLGALARHFEEAGARLPRLRQVSTYGEMVTPDLRDACIRAWGVGLVDMYSTQEIGFIAVQCPAAETYHVQSESVYVEVLDGAGQPCAPGEIGQVVVSTLHNYAMPLLRYDVGDYAEVGPPCPCGRGLPVLTRVMGRTRNMILMPDGRRVWPRLGNSAWKRTDAIRGLQIIQSTVGRLEFRLVTSRPLTALEETDLTDGITSALGYPFDVTLTYLDRIERGPGLKFESVICDLPPMDSTAVRGDGAAS